MKQKLTTIIENCLLLLREGDIISQKSVKAINMLLSEEIKNHTSNQKVKKHSEELINIKKDYGNIVK